MKVPSELICNDSQVRGNYSAGSAAESVSRKAQPEQNHGNYTLQRLTIWCLPSTGAFILAQHPPGQSLLRLCVCHSGTSVSLFVPSPGGCILRSASSHFHPQSHIPRQSFPFHLQPPSSSYSVLCTTRSPTLGRHLGPRDNDMPRVTFPVGEKKCPKHAVCGSCCVQEALRPKGRKDECEHQEESRKGLGVFVGDLKKNPLIIPLKFGDHESGQLIHMY